MNIFASSDCPVQSAQNHDDVRLNKMIVESFQMMSIAIAHHMNSFEIVKNKRGINFRRLTTAKCDGLMKPLMIHFNHPCSVWCRQSDENFQWLYTHTLAMIDERKYRFGKGHKTEERIQYIEKYKSCIPKGPLTDFAKSCRNHKVGSFKHINPTIIGYQNYMAAKWLTDKIKVKFTRRQIPDWTESLFKIDEKSNLQICLKSAINDETNDCWFINQPAINNYVLEMRND